MPAAPHVTSFATIRLVLLDDHALFRESLARYLASEPAFEVVGVCGTLAQALKILRSGAVDVVLSDFDLGAEHGNDFISAARAAGYRGRFLMVAGAADPRSSAAALQLGASGIFLKSDSPGRLVQAIRLVAAGAAWVDPRVVERMAERFTGPSSRDQRDRPLDERERRVLHGVLSGFTNREIGETVGLSEGAVKHVVQHLFTRAGVKSRSQLVRAALQGAFGAGRLWDS
jgi:two-component system, NarL family, nitrate/nitrite response regulator NarL